MDARTTLSLVVFVAAADTSALTACSSKTTALAVLHDWAADPVHLGVIANSIVGWIDHNYFVIFVSGILSSPVRVEDAHVWTAATNTAFCNDTEGASGLELGDTLGGRFAIDDTVLNWSLAAATANADAVNHKALLGLVAHGAGLVGAGWTGGTVDDSQLTVLPAANAQQKAKNIRLLLLV